MTVLPVPSRGTTPPAGRSTRPAGVRGRDWRMAAEIVAFTTPALLLFAVFVVWPILRAVQFSLYRWKGFGPLVDFVGLQNYVAVLTNEVFTGAVGHNLVIVVASILIQLPLPKGMDEAAVINAILPEKDVDGFHILNVGRLATGQKAMVPCTPLGCLMLLRDHLGSLSGRNAVVIGRSNIVGKPMAQLLLRDSATVTVAHSRTTDLAALCRQADILVAAVGRPHFVQGDWIKPGATVIDVGINRTDDGLVGDVDFAAAVQVAGAITPVPGGVGPMTIACLLANTLTATARSHGLPDPEGLTP